MIDFNGAPSQRVQPAAIPADAANSSSPRKVYSSPMEQSVWSRLWRSLNSSRSKATDGISSQSPISGKRSIPLLFVLALGFLIAVAIFCYVAIPRGVKQQSAVTRGKSLLGLSASSKAKPAPGKPFVPVAETHLPIPTVWTPAPGSQQQPAFANAPPMAPQTPTMPQALPQVGSFAPAQPIIPGKTSSFTPVTYPARHDKRFGGSCAGELTLNATGLTFSCADDPGGSLQVALPEIGAVDENGIELVSGKKYHFSIAGMSKSAEQQVFAAWLHQVR